MTFACLAATLAAERYEAPVPTVIDEGVIRSVSENQEPLGDAGRLFIPDLGIDVALYRVEFINLGPTPEPPLVEEKPEPGKTPSPAPASPSPASPAAVEQLPLIRETEKEDDDEAAEPEITPEPEEEWVDDGKAQILCDDWDSAVWLDGMWGLPNIIADHAYQGFEGIKLAQVGTVCYIKSEDGISLYTCLDCFTGHNNGRYLMYDSGDRLCFNFDDAICMYTCNECWENVTITLWKKIEVWI